MIATNLRPAGFWIRVGAYLVDGILIGLISQILGGSDRAGHLYLNVWGCIYFVVLWSSIGHGRTLGMRVLGLKVVRTDGTELSIGAAILRLVGLIVSFAALLLGVIWVAVDSRKQGWHDKIAGTLVVHA